MKRFKHLKNYKKFNPNNKVNEGWQTWANIAASALQLIPGMGRAISGPQSKTTYVYGQEKQQGDPLNKIKIAVGTTSNDACWYNQTNTEDNAQIQRFLPTRSDGQVESGKLFLKGNMDILRSNLQSGNKNPLEGFKFATREEADSISQTIKEKGWGNKSYLKNNERGAVDFVKIGDKSIEGKGSISFSWDDSGEIIVSGNGIYALIRAYAANLESGTSNFNILDLGKAEVSNPTDPFTNVESYQMETEFSKRPMVMTLNYLFEITTEMGNKNPNKNWHKDEDGFPKKVSFDPVAKQLIGKSDQEVMEVIKSISFIMNNDFMPRDSDKKLITDENKLPSFFKTFEMENMDVEQIKPYLERYQSTTDQKQRDKIFLEFIEANMKIWQNNFNQVMNGFETNYSMTGLPEKTDGSVEKMMQNMVGNHYEKGNYGRNFINSTMGIKQKEDTRSLKPSKSGEEKEGSKAGDLPDIFKGESLRYLKRFKRF
jgi:hypothetical protein